MSLCVCHWASGALRARDADCPEHGDQTDYHRLQRLVADQAEEIAKLRRQRDELRGVLEGLIDAANGVILERLADLAKGLKS